MAGVRADVEANRGAQGPSVQSSVQTPSPRPGLAAVSEEEASELGSQSSRRPSMDPDMNHSNGSLNPLTAHVKRRFTVCPSEADRLSPPSVGTKRALSSPADAAKETAKEKRASMGFLHQRSHHRGHFRHIGPHRKARNRLVQKHGECNVSLVNVPKQRRKYAIDVFTTLLDAKWRWCLLIFALGFLLSWLLFGVLYYVVMAAHGDTEEGRAGEAGWEPCIDNAYTFTAAFIFSVCTQHTIGYGKRVLTERCPEVLLLLCIQAMVGVFIQTLMAGVVFAKLARSKKRAETLIFSKNAVVAMREGELCLLFRVGDMRKSQLAEAHVRLQLIRKQITAEGELQPFHQFDMDVGYDQGLDRVFVMWPITICHVIDETSPLYDVSAEDLAGERFEIIVILEGVVQSTGMTTQAKTSYVPSELLWGHRFQKLLTLQKGDGDYRIDFAHFHKTYPVHTPTVSARVLKDMQEAGLQPELGFQTQNSSEIENGGATPYATFQPPEPLARPTIVPAGFSRHSEAAQDDLQHPADASAEDRKSSDPKPSLRKASLRKASSLQAPEPPSPEAPAIFVNPIVSSPASPQTSPVSQDPPKPSLPPSTSNSSLGAPRQRKMSTVRGHDIG